VPIVVGPSMRLFDLDPAESALISNQDTTVSRYERCSLERDAIDRPWVHKRWKPRVIREALEVRERVDAEADAAGDPITDGQRCGARRVLEDLNAEIQHPALLGSGDDPRAHVVLGVLYVMYRWCRLG